LIPEAARGLARAGVEATDYEPFLEIIRGRTETMHTGAQVQRKLYAHYQRALPRSEAFAATLEHYLDLADSGRPVHAWKLPEQTLTYREARAGS
jgi:hypothetical protein